MTRVCYFWSEEWVPARDALAEHAPQAVLLDTSGDDASYWQQFASVWDGTDDLVVIEHDITIHADVLPQFETCTFPFCTFAFPMFGPHSIIMTEGIACARYTAGVQQLVTVSAIFAHSRLLTNDGLHIAWCGMEAAILDAMQEKGIPPHTHYPAVGHKQK